MQENKKDSSEKQPSISFLSLLGILFADALFLLKKGGGFIYRFKFLLGGFIVLGIVAGISLFEVTPSTYSLNMIVRPFEMNEKVYGEMINSLNKLAKSGSQNELAKNLNISTDIAKSVIEIKGLNMQDIEMTRDTAFKSGRPFIIQFIVTTNKVADSLQYAIVNYFNSNSYLLKLKNNKIEIYKKQVAFINNELTKLDSLKGIYNQFLRQAKTPSMYYNNTLDPIRAYEISSQYERQKSELEQWLDQNKEIITVIDGVKPSRQRLSKSMKGFVFTYVIIFFLVGLLIALIWDGVKKN